MNEEHDNYFKELAGDQENPDFELAKATSIAQPKLKVKKAAEDDEMEPEGQLTIDVYQTPSEIVIESAMAGVEPDDIDVNVTNDSITIKGRRRRIKEVKDEDYFYQECYWGKFSRSVILPQEVDPEGSYVNFKNGILSVHLPKLNRKKARKLRVKLE